MRLPLLLCLLPAAAGAAPAPRLPVVAFLPLESVNLSEPERHHVELLLRRSLTVGKGYRLLAENLLEQELRARPASCVRDLPCMIDLGRAAGVNLVAAWRVGRLGNTTVVRLTTVDVARGARQGTWQEVLRTPGDESLSGALRRLAFAGLPAPPPGRPWYRQWWVWTAASVAVAGIVTSTVLLARRGSERPDVIIVPPRP